jgi:hypothetical protein
MSQNFVLDTGMDISDLKGEQTIPVLQPAELRYATYLALAAWAHHPILPALVSPEAVGIHVFSTALIQQYARDLRIATASQPGSPLFFLLEYAAAFYDSGANHLWRFWFRIPPSARNWLQASMRCSPRGAV